MESSRILIDKLKHIGISVPLSFEFFEEGNQGYHPILQVATHPFG